MSHRRAFLTTIAAAVPAALTVATGSVLEAAPQDNAKEAPSGLPSEKVRQFVASSHGNMATVKSLYKELPMLLNSAWDWKDGDWETGLGAASHVGNRDIAEFLLDQGARIDAFAITMLGHTEVLKSILTHFPKTHRAPGSHGIPLLSHAIAGGKKADESLQLLLDSGADVNATSQMGMTPLMMAASGGRVETVERLIQRGADPTLKDSRGLAATDYATKKEHTAVVKYLKNNS